MYLRTEATNEPRRAKAVLQMRFVHLVRIAHCFVLDSMEMVLLVLEMMHGSPSSLDLAMTSQGQFSKFNVQEPMQRGRVLPGTLRHRATRLLAFVPRKFLPKIGFWVEHAQTGRTWTCAACMGGRCQTGRTEVRGAV